VRHPLNLSLVKEILAEISRCRICDEFLPKGPRPIVAAHANSKLAIIGQAPGAKVHETGVPWDDPSGKRLRDWLAVENETFYDASKIALIPMGFCYPGKGKSGDLPPRKECAPLWHAPLMRGMKKVELILLIGKYAQAYYLRGAKKTLTANVMNFQEYLPKYFPLPHPSPRNNIWMKKNPEFSEIVLPTLQQRVKAIIR